MERFRIVDPNSEDAGLIQQAAQIAFEASQSISKIWLPTVAAAIEEVHESLKRDGISRVLVNDNRIGAWVRGFSSFSGWVVEIHHLVVARAEQGKGLGRRMVSHVEAWTMEQGAR